MTEDKQILETVPPVQVAIIGTGDGGIKHDTVAVTPDSIPNVAVMVITPIIALMVRFTNTFLASVLGIIGGGAVTGLIPFHDFWDLLVKSALLSLAPAIIGAIKDIITIFTKLETKYPLWTGNV